MQSVIDMKRKLIAVFVLLAVLLSACGGSVRGAVIREVPSELYTADEIDSAISVIKTEFSLSWSGCTLQEIAYAGDEMTGKSAEYYLREHYEDYSKSWGDFDELIVLTSTFDVDESGGDGSMVPNSTYRNWNWILVRSGGGSWRHVDHGYG